MAAVVANGSTTNSVPTLRAITYRLLSTPTKQLPHVAPHIASQLWNCKDQLAVAAGSTKQSSEASNLVHRFKTHVSQLLQARSFEERWAGIVLAKAFIEAGGIEVVSKANPWVRSLLAILKKPDPPTTRNSAVITLTRVFMLTWDYTMQVREITTPALPTFVSTCLSNVENKRCSASELSTVLEAFATLIPRHPTIFRTNESQIRALCLSILSTTNKSRDVSNEGKYYTEDHKSSAQRLLVLLHHCAPKQGGAEKWHQTFSVTIQAAHTTCDRIFRSVIEDWASTSGVQPSVRAHTLLKGEVEVEDQDAAGMSGWKGVFAGSERLISLLQVLQTHLETATAGPASIRIGALVDLLTRIFSVRVPSGKEVAIKSNQEVSKDEREAMFSALPGIHVAAVELAETLLRRFENALTSIVHPLLTSVTWVFEAESADAEVRTVVYEFVARVLKVWGDSLSREDVIELEIILRACCQDLMSADQATPRPANGTGGIDMGTASIKTPSWEKTAYSQLRDAAAKLLPLYFSHLPPAHISSRVRTVMERTAVLTQHKEALVACVLNPAAGGAKGKSQASLLPLLARLYPDVPEVEAILRPRMPVIRSRKNAAEDEDYDEDDQEEAVHAGVHEDDQFQESRGSLNGTHQEHAEADEDELYAVSPERSAPTSNDQEPAPPAGKRTATFAEDEPSAKRQRASPIAETLLPNPLDNVLGPDPLTARRDAPVTAFLSQEQPQSSFPTAPEPSQQAVTLPAAAREYVGTDAGPVGTADDDDDGSDFEIPPLTMEPSDDEEEDDED